MEGGLPEENIEEADTQEKFARFWGIYIIALNSNSLLSLTEISLITFFLHLQTNTEKYFTFILNYIQIHKCNDDYCLHKIKNLEDVGESDKKYHFYFPYELRNEAVVDNSMNSKYYTFSAARNYDCINSYNLLLIIV